MRISVLFIVETLCISGIWLAHAANGDSSVNDKRQPQAKRKLPKDPLYITDVDLENLYDEWEDADDEKLPPDELPPHKRPAPKLNIPQNGDANDLFKDPEKLMIASKKGKTVMAFVTIANSPTKEETDMLTQRWQVGLTNNHIKCERFVIGDDRAIFVFEDGALAFEAKNFLLEQPELKEYSIDNRSWHGKGYPVEYPNSPTKVGSTSATATDKTVEETASGTRDEL